MKITSLLCQHQNPFIVLAESTNISQTTESTNVTTARINSTRNDSGVSVNQTNALETQDPGEPTTESYYYSDDTYQEEDSSDDTTRGIF